jgi:hypothetical protein
MRTQAQYARLQLHGANYLMPSTVGLVIEQRDALQPNTEGGNATAWRTRHEVRWPAFSLDPTFKLTQRKQWNRALFLEAGAHSVGVIVDEVQMLSRADIQISAFTPLGAPPTRHGHLFKGAWVEGRQATLVIDPQTFLAYLQGFGR